MDRVYANRTCPYCDSALDPLPKAKKRCPACGRPIYVRSGPDGLTYLLQEVDLPTLEAAWDEHNEVLARRDNARQNRWAATESARSLVSYLKFGVEEITMQGAADADTCSACRAVYGRRYPIRNAPPIPIPGCTSDFCRCDYSPVVTPALRFRP